MDDQATLPHNFIALSQAGFSVFPVPPLSKIPSEWKHYQTNHADPITVAEWAVSDSNIGVATGAISGCFVLDLDNVETFEWIMANRGLPETVTVRTPRGYHFYFRHPGGRVKNRADLRKRHADLPCGIDIRGDGGFAIGAGSYYLPSPDEEAKGKRAGPYRFAQGLAVGDIEMADAPKWLLDVMHDEPYVAPETDDRPIPDAYAAKAMANALEAIATATAGSRNDTVNGVAYGIGRIVGAGALDRRDTEAALIRAARLVGQGKEEATATVRSGLTSGMKHPREMPVKDESDAYIAKPAADTQLVSAPPRTFGHDAFRASDVASIDAPEQEWVIEGFVPLGHVTTLFGDGGVGKSLLVQTMASHIASGEPFADRDVKKLKIAAIMCEDDAAELNRRQRRINARLFDDSEVGDFTILSRIGEDNVLGMISQGRWEPTKLYLEIEEWVEANAIRVLIVDNIMQVFGGDINDNQSVTWFVNSLTRLARRMNGAVILLGHIAKSENSRFSGSMAWNNSVRARLFLSRVEQDQGQAMELRKLTVDKSNYGKAGLSIDLALHDGVLIDKRSVSKAEADAAGERVARARNAVKKLIEREATRSISMSHQSPAYIFAPERLCFLRRAGAPLEKDVKLAIEQMLLDGTLGKETREWSDTAKKKRERIVLHASRSQGPQTAAAPRGDGAERVKAMLEQMQAAA